jgi:peptide/nickel transport system ATP-binding protein
VGESGSGKSTTAKAIAGLIEYSSGTLTYNDQTLKGIHPDLQMIFQDPASSLNPRMTVGRNISEPLLHRNNEQPIHERVMELLKHVDLSPEYYHRYPHELSGGQQQRIGIARALASNPKLIICDEPVSALDVSIQAQVLNLLKHLQRSLGLSLLFITHDISVVRFIADDVIVMKSGEIVERGATEELLHAAQHEYTQQLLSAVPQMDF